MENWHMEFGQVSFNKSMEAVCGDFAYVLRDTNQMTIALSDGLGSGVKANILATLTSKILSTLLAKKLPLEDCVYTIASTLPMCKERRLAYATFTGLQIENNQAYLIQYDNPMVLLLRKGKCVKYPYTSMVIDSKEIYESKISLEDGDFLILLTDGVTSAGLGKTNAAGWKLEEIESFVEQWYDSELSPQRLAALIIDACLALELGENHDDMTAIVVKVRKRKAVNLLIGPPENKEEDNRILRLFFAKEGAHIVCGGTTAKTVSHYLQKPIVSNNSNAFDEVPATSSIEGVDLVTEGVITLEALAKFVHEYIENHYLSLSLRGKTDGVSLLATILLEEMTDINIFFGRAVNEAHEGMDIEFAAKLKAIEQLEKDLTTLGKNVKVSMC